ncbi:cytochrome b561 and DOMON domain-containing protein At5g35735-like [Aristolochia californica]|uniref:cytochrome b561 and DOMON domain-containing protein At5g35735-like n=1 Tax=Aristolochia californica TaxID=171875 RepID=UPI0035E00F57
MAPDIQKCKRLGQLGAELGWNYNTNSSNKSIDFFFGVKLPDPTGWAAWGINPGPIPQMVGTRSIIAIRHANGTLQPVKYNITRDWKHGCRIQQDANALDLDLKVIKLNFSDATMFLTMHIRADLPELNLSRLNHVWQVGSDAVGDIPRMHGKTLQNFDSCETIDLYTGKGKSYARHRRRLRKLHGVFNIAGWGTLLPVGIIFARYFKKFPFRLERWFRFHVCFQLLAFTLGTCGWIIGISLGNSSENYTFTTHRILGISVFALALVQMLAVWLRPNKKDDFRQYWHMYHHCLGYSLFALIVVNIFQGIKILKPVMKWKWAYVSILSALGFVVLLLEIKTWYKFLSEKSKEKQKNGTPDQN